MYQGVLSLPFGGTEEQHTKLYATCLSPRSWLSIPGRGCCASHSLLPMLQEFQGATKLDFPYLVLRGHNYIYIIIIEFGLKKQYKC